MELESRNDLFIKSLEGAFNLATMIRWLDFNDTWLAKEWGHPSDNLGAILALTDWISQREEKFVLFQS